MALRPESLTAYLKRIGSNGGKASWRGLSKAERTARAKRAAAKRNGNGK